MIYYKKLGTNSNTNQKIFISKPPIIKSFCAIDPRYTNQRGSMLMLCIPWLFLLLFLLLGIWKIAEKSLHSNALDLRLEVCAVRFISGRQKLYQSLTQSNHVLEGIQLALYALRGAKMVPVLGALSTLSEIELLNASKFLVSYQNLQITKTQAEELPQRLCKKDPFSNSLSLCIFEPLNLDQFKRTKTLFPDIPGTIQYKIHKHILSEVQCASALFKNHRSILFLHGNPNLNENQFYYSYEAKGQRADRIDFAFANIP